MNVGRRAVVVDPVRLAKMLLKPLAARFRRWGSGPSRGGRADVVMAKYTNPGEARKAARIIDAFGADHLFVDTMFRTPVLDHLRSRPMLFNITHDLFHERHRSLSALGYRVSPERLTIDDEVQALERHDVLIAGNVSDQERMRDLVKGPRVVRVTMPVEPVIGAEGARDPKRCLFVGSKALHNVDGLRWFLAEIWPLVTERLPDARFHIFGSATSAIADPPAGVILGGWIEDLTPDLLKASVAVAPLRGGSGLKVKLLDYIAHGLPCVTTTSGVSGFAEEPDRPFLVRDEPRDFADALISILSDPAKAAEWRHSAYGFCERFSASAMFAPVEALMSRASQTVREPTDLAAAS
ncbi:MAG: glycosyltransferase [Geminicoccaceae bacterium]